MKRNAACPDSVVLTRGALEGEDQEIGEHLAACPSCAREVAATRALTELGRELPDGAPSEEIAEAVRGSLVAAAQGGNSGTTREWKRYLIPFAVAAAASVALAVGAILLSGGPSETQTQSIAAGAARRATVHAQKGAEHILLGAQPDEMVRLTEGTITVQVEKLRAGERFRVVTGDAEVEVRGTAFDVTAKDDALVGVRVLSGKVEVRPVGREIVALSPGEQWKPPAARGREGAGVAMPSPAEPDAPQGEVEPASAALDRAEVRRPDAEAAGVSDKAAGSSAPVSPAETAFDAGWDALKQGRAAEAATLFGQAAELGNGESILEDAVFWRAVALDRAGHRGPAADGMRDFLQRFPSSARRGEVSVMLGWKLLETGDPAGAKLLFESALGDRVSWVRTSAARGIFVAGRRPKTE